MKPARRDFVFVTGVFTLLLLITLSGCDSPATSDPNAKITAERVVAGAPASGRAVQSQSSNIAPSSSSAAPATQASIELRDWVVAPAVDAAEATPPSLRIVCLSPVATEICCALGLRDNLVGRSNYCTHPPDVASVPEIGSLLDVSAERLAQLRPDVVFYSGTSRTQVERLTPLRLRLESLPDASLDDVYRSIERVGAVVDRPRTATTLCDGIRADLARVAKNCSASAGAKVLLTIEPLSDPPRAVHVASAGSYLDDLLRSLGHSNAIQDRQALFAPVSLETIALANPDVVLELAPSASDRPAGDASALKAWERLGPLAAVKARRVHVLTGGDAFLPGPRVAFISQKICSALASVQP